MVALPGRGPPGLGLPISLGERGPGGGNHELARDPVAITGTEGGDGVEILGVDRPPGRIIEAAVGERHGPAAEHRAERLSTTLSYASPEDALRAVFCGGPVALAYSRFDAATRRAVHAEYLDSIAAYRTGGGYQVPGEFGVAAARAPLPQ